VKNITVVEKFGARRLEKGCNESFLLIIEPLVRIL
jgi:hypothetical protein